MEPQLNFADMRSAVTIKATKRQSHAIYIVSQKRPTCDLPTDLSRFILSYLILSCYNVDIHGSITIIFGISFILYFPTSSNLCFCTTWGNRKPGNCVFSLKRCMILTKNTRTTHTNTLKISTAYS